MGVTVSKVGHSSPRRLPVLVTGLPGGSVVCFWLSLCPPLLPHGSFPGACRARSSPSWQPPLPTQQGGTLGFVGVFYWGGCFQLRLSTAVPMWEANPYQRAALTFSRHLQEKMMQKVCEHLFLSEHLKSQIAKCFNKGECCNPGLMIREQRRGSQAALPLQGVSRRAAHRAAASALLC